MKTIQAMVNPRLLTKANRLFTGTLSGRIIEILQNARRAEATKVEIANEDGYVTVRDNGRGVDGFSRLLDLGGSGWEESFEESEDPAGVGLFCLAPREVAIRSSGQIAVIPESGWTGETVYVREDRTHRTGTTLRFRDDPWTKNDVEPLAVFSGLQVVVNGETCAQDAFVSAEAKPYPGLGCRLEVCEAGALHPWHRSCVHGRYSRDNALVNFHGQVVAFDCHPVSEHHLHFLVDMTGEATGIRLMLPARTRIVENEAFKELKDALEVEAYRYLQRRGHHRLPYKEYLRARELGIELPEAEPTFSVGLLGGGDPPDPVEVVMPEGFPLAECYRFDADFKDGGESDEANVHLLAALGKFDTPFIPVSIHGRYDGYSWAKLPSIGKVEFSTGRELHSGYIWTGTLTCVDSITVTAHASNGRVFSSQVCMARAAERPDKAPNWADDHVLVTPEAHERLCASEIWHHLGGWYDEGDTYDTQEWQFQEELDRFWMNLVGPDEQLRRAILDALQRIEQKWKFVKVFPGGKVRIRFHDGLVKNILPAKSHR